MGEQWHPDFERVPFKPLNPWGRPMPTPKRAIRTEAPEQLYQVFVELTKPFKQLDVVLPAGSLMAVGPKWGLQLAEQFCAAIKEQIRKNAERLWINPTVMPCVAKD